MFPTLHNLPPVTHESGGGAPNYGSGGAGPDIAAACAALERAMGKEKDPEEKQKLAALHAKCLEFEANKQKEKDSAMGVSAQHKFIRRSKQQSDGY